MVTALQNEARHLPYSRPKTKGKNYLHKQLERILSWKKALITVGMTCKDWGMSGRIHSQWHCSAASQSLHTTHPSKKCHPLWSLQHNPNPLPFDHYSSNTQQSHTSRYRTSFSHSLSILLSLWLSACPLVRRNQPVSPLWADMAASPPLRRPVEATKHAI